jgi:RNA polymerase sigma-70 factor (ECF subfamily)
MDWNQIVEQHSSIVWRTVSRLIPEQDDAADCFQSTFISAWTLSRKQSIRHWPGLLRTLATARALERRRELARNRSRQCEFPGEGLIDRRASDPARDAESLELEARLRLALAEIAPREAEVFCLACLEGMTYREIGLHMDLSVNHVGVLLNRARSQLRAKLADFSLESNRP